ncbi:MAG: nucleotide pyrophosphohydrolase [Gammaproteobacteria bacterium]|nr:nucleotide pyrophosphohydrolase [Gammaproteobacteria bacterium]MDH5800210.1 nucleotide pyrophosphohydrolase [Gammaproteobacteria bacterium]
MRQFAQERDWEQFHSPKNLSMALVKEAAELVEHFQWLTEPQSYALESDKRDQVRYEMADILIYLVRIADQLDIELLSAVKEKIQINKNKYPVDKVKGSSKKYNEY